MRDNVAHTLWVNTRRPVCGFPEDGPDFVMLEPHKTLDALPVCKLCLYLLNEHLRKD